MMKIFKNKESHPANSKEKQKEKVFLNTPAEQVQHFLEGGFEEEAKIYEKVAAFAEAVKEAGGQALMVGGSVRDEVMGMPCKDYDIEVCGVEPQEVHNLASAFGEVKETGASFTVLKLQMEGFDIDISLPRRESSTGTGHKDFSFEADPYMSIEEASRRRDFTMNAIGKDILTGEIYDYFGGMKDIKERRLRIVDEQTFTEDSLRVLRGVQFTARFGLFIEDETMRVMRETRDDMKHLPKERFREEWGKLLLRPRKPSLGLHAAMEIGIFHTIHPYVSEMPITPQEEEWHPEGDVWTHTLMVVDEMAKIVEQERIDKDEAMILMLAAFCHDLAKPQKTQMANGKVTSYGHEEAGAKLTEKFLYEIGIEGKTREIVKNLVTNHLVPTTLYTNEVERGQKITDGAIKRLVKRLYPATVKQLALLAKADNLGRGPFVDPDFPERSFMPTEYPAGDWLVNRCAKVEDLNIGKAEKPRPPITGRDLIALGFKPGRAIGDTIRLAEEMHVDGLTREEILLKIDQQIMAYKEENKNKTPPLEEVYKTLHSKYKEEKVGEEE